jgi:hypothetical protein
MVLNFSKRVVWLCLVEIVLLLALADHESQTAREIGIATSDVELNVFTALVLAGDFDHLHVVLDQPSRLNFDFQRDDLLNWLKGLTRGEDDGLALCDEGFFFRLSFSLRLCADSFISLFGRIGVFIKQTHQLFILSLLNILSLDG